MTPSSIMEEDSLKRILLGVVIGAVITMLAGFHTMGWTTENTAKEMAKKSANAAVVEALAPICVDKFLRAVEAAKNKVELMKVSSSDQGSFIEKGGWATLPGNSSANGPAVAQACAKCSALSSNQGLPDHRSSPAWSRPRRRRSAGGAASSCPIAFFTRVTRSGEAEVSLLASAWACAALRGSMSMLRFCASARRLDPS